jgi:hypothetical protein
MMPIQKSVLDVLLLLEEGEGTLQKKFKANEL